MPNYHLISCHFYDFNKKSFDNLNKFEKPNVVFAITEIISLCKNFKN